MNVNTKLLLYFFTALLIVAFSTIKYVNYREAKLQAQFLRTIPKIKFIDVQGMIMKMRKEGRGEGEIYSSVLLLTQMLQDDGYVVFDVKHAHTYPQEKILPYVSVEKIRSMASRRGIDVEGVIKDDLEKIKAKAVAAVEQLDL